MGGLAPLVVSKKEIKQGEVESGQKKENGRPGPGNPLGVLVLPIVSSKELIMVLKNTGYIQGHISRRLVQEMARKEE